MTTVRMLALLLCAAPAAPHMAAAGPITPPAGPVAPTHKTMSQVEPRTPIGPGTTPGDADSVFRITQSGSYYLTGHLTGEPGKHGIEIAAPDVTIDLMGFTLEGVDGSLSGVYAPWHITASGRPVVRNGSVRGWGGHGLNIDAASAAVENVGAFVNAGRGIHAGPYAAVSRCTATDNGADGFFAATGSMLADCHAAANSGGGFSAGLSVVVRSCRAEHNGAEGFSLVGAATLEGCLAHGNGAAGAAVGADSLITRSRFDHNDGPGLLLSTATRVVDCIASENTGHGISALDRCTITGNACDGNVGSGIRISGSHNRVQSNTVTLNAVGISAGGGGNLIAGNAALDNESAHYQIPSGNFSGPIRTNAGTITTDNPWVNFGM